jgi:hypothetical protein
MRWTILESRRSSPCYRTAFDSLRLQIDRPEILSVRRKAADSGCRQQARRVFRWCRFRPTGSSGSRSAGGTPRCPRGRGVLKPPRLGVEGLPRRNMPRLDQGQEAAVIAQTDRATELSGGDQLRGKGLRLPGEPLRSLFCAGGHRRGPWGQRDRGIPTRRCADPVGSRPARIAAIISASLTPVRLRPSRSVSQPSSSWETGVA